MTATATTAAASFLVQRLSQTAQLPTRGSALAAGYDLHSYARSSLSLKSVVAVLMTTRLTRLLGSYSAEDKTVPAQGKALISTGLAIAVPEGTYGRVAPRSGLGACSASNRPAVEEAEREPPSRFRPPQSVCSRADGLPPVSRS